VDFAKMLDMNLALLRAASGQNNDSTVMKMASGTTALFE
jgi:hypothetical protein